MKQRTAQDKSILLQIWSGGDIQPTSSEREIERDWKRYGAQADKWEADQEQAKEARAKAAYDLMRSRTKVEGIETWEELPMHIREKYISTLGK